MISLSFLAVHLEGFSAHAVVGLYMLAPLGQRSLMDRLKGRTILIVEDEALIALDVARSLEEVGCTVVGPVVTVSDAMEKLSSVAVDGVVLDVNLQGEKSIPIMDTLVRGGVPFMIVTGYAPESIPRRFHGKPFLGKPFSHMDLVVALDAALRATNQASDAP